MKRQPSPALVQRHADLLERIRALKAEQPSRGYRRIWAYLRFVERQPVNKKLSLRPLRAWHLLPQPNCRLQAKRAPTRSKPKPPRPNEWWGIEMIKVPVQGFGWMSICVVRDGYTKTSVGHDAGLPCRAPQGLAALEMAVHRQCPHGVRGQGPSLMSDNGCQPTSAAFMQACSNLGLQRAFTSYTKPKGNAEPERVMRTLKYETPGSLSRRDCCSATALLT